MPTYAYTEPGFRSADFQADTDNDADQFARSLLRGGDYEPGDPPATFRVTGHVIRVGPDGGEEDGWSVTVDIDPPEPACPVRKDAGHDWSNDHRMVGGLTENPGVFGSGHGQVRTVEACLACGARKTDDLGGTDSASGDNMRVITYEPPGTVTPPGMPVYWSVCSGPVGDARVTAVEPGPAGVDIPDEILLWAGHHGLSPDSPNIYLLVATEDEAGEIPGEIAYCKGTVTYAEDQAIRAALAASAGADCEDLTAENADMEGR
jgi:hypothetical protein